MKTLTIIFNINHEVGLKLSGLSMKALSSFSDAKQDLCRSDLGYYALMYERGQINPDTANVKSGWLLPRLRTIYESVPFNKIKTQGHYELTAEELYERVINESKIN